MLHLIFFGLQYGFDDCESCNLVFGAKRQQRASPGFQPQRTLFYVFQKLCLYIEKSVFLIYKSNFTKSGNRKPTAMHYRNVFIFPAFIYNIPF